MRKLIIAGVLGLAACGAEDNNDMSTCAGARVDRDGAEFCVVAAQAHSPCPPDKPERTLFEGTAICGASPPADPEVIAVEALRSGRILARGDVQAIELPPEARQAPGVPAGRIEAWGIAVPAGPAWFNAEGAPLCYQIADHLEATWTSKGLLISAWDRVVCGAEPEENPYELKYLPVTFEAPPGRHTVLAATPYEARPMDVVVVDLHEVCDPQPACFTGFLFAACGGEGSAAIWCDGFGDCRWFTGGCPAASHPIPLECGWIEGCPDEYLGWGSTPQSRDRALNLAVAVDSTLEVSAEPMVECACEALACDADLCPFVPERLVLERVDVRAPDQGMLVLRYFGLRGDMVVEIDVDRPAGPLGRACLYSTGEDGWRSEPVCATAGSVRLDREVETEADAAAVHGEVQAQLGAQRVTATF